jgi:hypothetical protein
MSVSRTLLQGWSCFNTACTSPSRTFPPRHKESSSQIADRPLHLDDKLTHVTLCSIRSLVFGNILPYITFLESARAHAKDSTIQSSRGRRFAPEAPALIEEWSTKIVHSSVVNVMHVCSLATNRVLRQSLWILPCTVLNSFSLKLLSCRGVCEG